MLDEFDRADQVVRNVFGRPSFLLPRNTDVTTFIAFWTRLPKESEDLRTPAIGLVDAIPQDGSNGILVSRLLLKVQIFISVDQAIYAAFIYREYIS